MRRFLLWGPPIAYMALIFYLSSNPAPLPDLTRHVWDKLLHATEYAVLAVLFYRAFRGEGLGWAQAALLALLASSVYGATDEWHQAFVPPRTSDVRDWMADTLGAAIAIAGYTTLTDSNRFTRFRRLSDSGR